MEPAARTHGRAQTVTNSHRTGLHLEILRNSYVALHASHNQLRGVAKLAPACIMDMCTTQKSKW